ncbi:MAG: glutamine-hydrolyzing carbamoyl-phosphate synthase small subunit [Ruminococcaceae bacterium]|nr:glutamine-hydrolyzing carbamoyl-phosphate synthase small subunit [Oscillospiraceae bacterium]
MAFLVLSNGTVFEGERIGAHCDSVGELVFTTSVVGYLETLTDPRYAGQIVVQTFPLIGNYGVIEEDFSGEFALGGYVVRELCDTPSNFRSQYDLDTLLKNKGICGICGVDTRELTRIIRDEGTVNAMICDEVPSDLTCLKAYCVKGAVAKVGSKEKKVYAPTVEKKYDVALVDYGTQLAVIDALCGMGCEVTVVPSDTSAEEIIALSADGIVLSNGPGDPCENTFCIEQIKKIMGKVPVLAIGLGHQMAALSVGGTVSKLEQGHRGSNQPVKDAQGTRTYITSQNHGFAVDYKSVADKAKQTFVNANDGSCEGLEYTGMCCISVQFVPEIGASSCDTSFIFDKFEAMMGGKSDAEG